MLSSHDENHFTIFNRSLLIVKENKIILVPQRKSCYIYQQYKQQNFSIVTNVFMCHGVKGGDLKSLSNNIEHKIVLKSWKD